MANHLEKIDIFGLHNVRDYSISFKDNKLIIVGENGSGKTTIFKIIYYALSCDWYSLLNFAFDSISIHFSGNDAILIEKKLLHDVYPSNYIIRDAAFPRGLQQNIAVNTINRKINNFVSPQSKDYNNKSEAYDGLLLNSAISNRNNTDNLAIRELSRITQQINEAFDVQILYLPTYRRIEEQLKNIFPNMNSDDWNKRRKKPRKLRATELVEFGMEDVERAVKEYQNDLNDFSRAHQNKLTLGYLSEIISKKYEEVDLKEIKRLSTIEIADILNRIDSSILPDSQKWKIVEILNVVKETNKPPNNVQDKIICHYFLNLIDFNTEINKRETTILTFIKKCNSYLVNNILSYDNKTFSCKAYNKHGNDIGSEIHFQDLSSGEKQIVSLFSYLNLTQEKSVFVFIDEPELSLSVDWQRTFLVDILSSACCKGLFATTHSPFIFDNELEEHVHGINEFCTRG